MTVTRDYNTRRLKYGLPRSYTGCMEKILSYFYIAVTIITINELTGSFDKNSLKNMRRECPKILQNVARIRHVIIQI